MDRLEKLLLTLGAGFVLWLLVVGGTHFYINSVMSWYEDVEAWRMDQKVVNK